MSPIVCQVSDTLHYQSVVFNLSHPTLLKQKAHLYDLLPSHADVTRLAFALLAGFLLGSLFIISNLVRKVKNQLTLPISLLTLKVAEEVHRGFIRVVKAFDAVTKAGPLGLGDLDALIIDALRSAQLRDPEHGCADHPG